MSVVTDFLKTANTRISESVAVALRVDYRGRRFAEPIARSLVSEVRLRLNQYSNGVSGLSIDSQHPKTGYIDELGFAVGRDENGHLRGSNIPWHYPQDLCAEQETDEDKRAHLDHMIAQLPAEVSFEFKTDPRLRDRDLIRAAFERAGFHVKQQKTYVYEGTPGQDPAEKIPHEIRGKLRGKLNQAWRELEFVPMSVREFFEYYRKNLRGEPSYFHLNIDQALMEEAVKGENPMAEIIAVRFKDKPEAGIQAATLCTTGADGYMKLLRISYPRILKGEIIEKDKKPHEHANKMIVAEAMRRATERGLILDTDGRTPEAIPFYERFGVFKEVEHDLYTRLSLGCAVSQLTDRLNSAAQVGRQVATAKVVGSWNSAVQSVRETAASLAARLGLDPH